MRGLSGFTIIMATTSSTIIHFFVLTLVDTIPLVPKEIATRPETIEVELSALSMESTVPHEEKEEGKAVEATQTKKIEIKKPEKKKEEKKEVQQKDKVSLVDRSKEKKGGTQVDDEEKRLAAIKEIERKVAGRTAESLPAVIDAEIDAYPGMVEERVKGFWVIPNPLTARGLKAVVSFEIDKKGAVSKLRLQQSSGSPPFDQSAMRAISKAAPFPPPPRQLSSEEFVLTFQP